MRNEQPEYTGRHRKPRTQPGWRRMLARAGATVLLTFAIFAFMARV